MVVHRRLPALASDLVSDYLRFTNSVPSVHRRSDTSAQVGVDVGVLRLVMRYHADMREESGLGMGFGIDDIRNVTCVIVR